MEVEHVRDLGEGHQIELGRSTWSEDDRSVRDRWPTKTGGFSPRSSSEGPISSLVAMLEFVAEHDELPADECERIIAALAASVRWTLRSR